MQIPRKPVDEQQRLQALYDTDLLDSLAEERFDRITRLVQRFFAVPIALVSLVDSERQWFKSKQGLAACETGREISFCGHAILSPEIFVVADAALDPRFADNPLVTDAPYIRFYAGIPLFTAGGFCIGTLCIIDTKPRDLTAEQIHVFHDFAAMAMAEINLTEMANGVKLRDIIVKTQQRFIHDLDKRQVFEQLLSDMLSLTGSEYGFVGEVLYDEQQRSYLKTYALTNISWNEETSALFAKSQQQGMEFRNHDMLFGAVLKTGQLVISNDPSNDPRSGGLPPGHPPLNAFMGIPIYFNQQMVAMLGLANKAGGYQSSYLDYLSPLLTTIGQLVNVMRLQQEHHQALNTVVRLSRVIHQAHNGILLINEQGDIEWLNDGFTRMNGYLLHEIAGQKLADFLAKVHTPPASIELIRRGMLEKQSFELEICKRHKHGTEFWVRLSGNPTYKDDGQHDGFMLIETDISQEKITAEQIVLSERRLSAIIEGTHIGTWEWQPQTGQAIFNERWADIVGYTLEELFPINIDTWTALTHPEDLPKSAAALQRHFSGLDDYYDCVVRMKHKHGHWVWVHDRGRVYRWTEDRQPLLMCGTHADITEQVQLLERMKEQKSFLENIFNSSVTAITVLNSDGKLVFANAGAERILGLSLSKGSQNHLFYDDPIWQIQSLDGKALLKHELPFWQVQTTGKAIFDFKHSIVWPDGQWRALSINGAPFITDDQQTQYVFSVQDITAQVLASRALEYNEFRLRSLFELAPVGIALNDFNTGHFIDVNQALLEPTGYSKEEFIQLSYWSLTPAEFESEETLQRALLAETGRYGPYEKEFIRKDGSCYPVLLNGVMVTDNQGRQLIWSIVEDISERKRLARMKDEFVSTVSHELRTPLTAIAGGLDLLQTVVHAIPEPMQPLLTIAQRNSKKLLGLVNDLLDMEKLLAGKIQLQLAEYKVCELIQNALDNMQSYAKLHDISLSFEKDSTDCHIEVDQARFEQVMANLLSNAVKFSAQGQQVLVKVEQNQHRVKILVSDEGTGIPMDFQPRIFQKFAQADGSDSRLKSGSGLGLAISKELVERMGGTIDFQSIEGEGTTFWLEWPSSQ